MLAKLNHISGMSCAPSGKRPAEPRRNHVGNGRRHNPLRTLPSTDDMIAFRLKFSSFSNPQTLSHASFSIDSQFGSSSRVSATLLPDELLTWIIVRARKAPAAQGPGISVAPDSRPTSPPDTP